MGMNCQNIERARFEDTINMMSQQINMLQP